MSKTVRENPTREGPAIRRSSAASQNLLLYATLAGLAVLLFLGFQSWAENRSFRKSLNDRLSQIETRITQLSAKVEAAPARAQQPQRRGPDPNKVYTVKTAGRPSRGPKDAPITIAEFSDFQ